jgi:hypothetical protein
MATVEVVTDFGGMQRVVPDANQRLDRLVDLWDMAATAARVWGVAIDAGRAVAAAGDGDFALVLDALVYRLRLESDGDAAVLAAEAGSSGVARLILAAWEPERWASPIGTAPAAAAPAVWQGLKRSARDADDADADTVVEDCAQAFAPSLSPQPQRQRQRLAVVQTGRMHRVRPGESAPLRRCADEAGLDCGDEPLLKRQRVGEADAM